MPLKLYKLTNVLIKNPIVKVLIKKYIRKIKFPIIINDNKKEIDKIPTSINKLLILIILKLSKKSVPINNVSTTVAEYVIPINKLNIKSVM